MVELATTSGVELGHARVVPVSVSAAAADPAPPPSEASPTPAPLPEPPSVWASRLTGGNSGAPRVEREKPDATRAMKPQ
jgi:hypothetical protein